jgi:putative ABC transport system permease protein
VSLHTPTGPIEFRVAGVFYDYATDGGKVVMDRGIYERYWQDDSLNALAIYVSPATDAEEVGERFMETLGRTHHLTLLSNNDLTQRILRIFDKTFAVTYALELIAILVALLGITNALLASIVERRRELAILRSIGGMSSHIRRIFLWESGYLGIIGTVFGCLAGLSLAFVLIRVVNMQSFGWSIHFGVPWVLVGSAMIVTCGVSIAAGYVPARVAARVSVARELQCE